jgi:hypothetical protein
MIERSHKNKSANKSHQVKSTTWNLQKVNTL